MNQYAVERQLGTIRFPGSLTSCVTQGKGLAPLLFISKTSGAAPALPVCMAHGEGIREQVL